MIGWNENEIELYKNYFIQLDYFAILLIDSDEN